MKAIVSGSCLRSAGILGAKSGYETDGDVRERGDVFKELSHASKPFFSKKIKSLSPCTDFCRIVVQVVRKPNSELLRAPTKKNNVVQLRRRVLKGRSPHGLPTPGKPGRIQEF